MRLAILFSLFSIALLNAQVTAVIQTTATFPYCVPCQRLFTGVGCFTSQDFTAIGGDSVEWRYTQGPDHNIVNMTSRNRTITYDYQSSWAQVWNRKDTLHLKVWDRSGNRDSTYMVMDFRVKGVIDISSPLSSSGIVRRCSGSSLYIGFDIDYPEAGATSGLVTIHGPNNYYYSGVHRFGLGFWDTLSNITQTNSGIYNFSLETNGCLLNDSVRLSVIETPTAIASSNTPVCMGQSIRLSSMGSTFYGPQQTYLWRMGSYLNFTANPIINNAVLNQAGNYILVVRDEYPTGPSSAFVCESPPAFTFVQVLQCSTDVTEAEGTPIIAYPNPTTGPLVLTSGYDWGEAKVDLFDMSGRQVREFGTMLLSESMDALLDLSGLPAGEYVLRVANGGKEEAVTVVKY